MKRMISVLLVLGLLCLASAVAESDLVMPATKLEDRFIKYVKYPTTSYSSSSDFPSNPLEKDLALALIAELQAMGISDARMDEYGYVYASIPATDESKPAIGLISHMDVSEQSPGEPVNPQIIEDYDGAVIELLNGLTIDPEVYPHLNECVGKRIIVTDGNTLLGSDDKSGIAEIMTAAEILMLNPNLSHGKVCIAFCPDEEIGRGTEHFNIEEFGADLAYTVDGGRLGEIIYENFDAATAHITVHGVSTHPGDAKGIMKNAITIGAELISLLPPDEVPEKTEGREGFYFVNAFSGDCELMEIELLVRDFDRDNFEMRKKRIQALVDEMNLRHGEGTLECDIADDYYNMLEVIKDHMDLVERLEQAFRAQGIEPIRAYARGGTDGSELSFMGLPCPDISAGGMNFHSRREYVAIDDMEAIAGVLVELLTM